MDNSTVPQWVDVRATFRWMIGVAIAYLLLSSATAHLINPYQFLSSIRAYDILSPRVAVIAAMTIPFLHITLSLCLLLRHAEASAYLLGAVLFATYTMAQCYTLLRGMEIDCGCFGAGATDKAVSYRSLGLAALSTAACLVGWIWASNKRSISFLPILELAVIA